MILFLNIHSPPCNSGVSDVSEIWTMANMVNKFVTNFPVDLLIQLGHEAFQQLIAAVAAFTGQCISALQPSSYDSSCMEALDMLLDAWGLLGTSRMA